MKPPKHITDLGDQHNFRSEGSPFTVTIPRYGVWAPTLPEWRYRVIDTGNDLAALQAKHGPDLEVRLLVDPNPEQNHA